MRTLSFLRRGLGRGYFPSSFFRFPSSILDLSCFF
jgi:hypothetical protein